jgi:hypothetical protein
LGGVAEPAGAAVAGGPAVLGVAAGLEAVASPPSEGGLALLAGPVVSAGRLGVAAGTVALVLALVPVSAPAEGMAEALADQSLDARCFGEAFR